MKIWKVTIEDLTHLGGPMGTEYVTTIGSKEFSSKEKAEEYIKSKCINSRGFANGTPFEMNLGYYDAGSRGYRLEEVEIL